MKYLLVDGNNLLYRAHFAKRLTDKKGNTVSGVFGVMRMVTKLIKKFRPDVCVICWDLGKSRERLKLYPEYKANRDARDPQIKKDILRQAKSCQKIFDMLPVRQVVVDGVEADDSIGILCEKLKGTKIVVSNDHDFVQLVGKKVSVYNPKLDKLMTPANIEKIIGFPVKHYVLWKCMVGDSSDNIKGIKGVGEKTATKIIVERINGGKKRPITKEEQKILDRNKYLITIGALTTKKQMSQIKKCFVSQKGKEINFNGVRVQFARFGFKTLYYNFDEWTKPLRKLKC